MTHSCSDCHVEWQSMDGDDCWLCFKPGQEWGLMPPWNSMSAMVVLSRDEQEKPYDKEGAPGFLRAN